MPSLLPTCDTLATTPLPQIGHGMRGSGGSLGIWCCEDDDDEAMITFVRSPVDLLLVVDLLKIFGSQSKEEEEDTL